MAGAVPDFDAAEFRANLRATMTMGLPVDAGDVPTFHFQPDKSWPVADAAGAPLDWTSVPTGEGDRDDVAVLCAVKPDAPTRAVETAFGGFDFDRATLFLFEDEWEAVADFVSVTLGGNLYLRAKRLYPATLHDVTINRVVVVALDES